MKVLVTGATSLMGRTLVERLRFRGDTVTTLQRHPSGDDVDEVLGDVADPTAAARAVAGQDAMIHLAAKVAATGPWIEFEHANITGTAVLLDAARTAGVERFVHVSTPSVAHGGAALVGVGAEPADPTTTRGHYATSKAIAECHALAQNRDHFSVLAVRPHLVWGPGDEQLVGRLVARARQGRLAVIGSGAALIDSTYLDNAADALIAAVDHAHLLGGEALVVSNGEPRPVKELIDRILAAAGLAATRQRVPRRLAFVGGLVAERAWDLTARTDDPPMTSFVAEQLSTAHWFDQRRTRAALEWQPAVTLDEGFERLEAWFRSTPVSA